VAEINREVELIERIRDAVFGLPFAADRIAAGQQFNAYEGAGNDDGDDEDWAYELCIGPITDRRFIADVGGKSRADLLESALKLAAEVAFAGQSQEPLLDVLREGAPLQKFGAAMFDILFERFVEGDWEIEINDLITDHAVAAGLVSKVKFNPDEHIDNSGACEPGDDYFQITAAGQGVEATLTKLDTILSGEVDRA